MSITNEEKLTTILKKSGIIKNIMYEAVEVIEQADSNERVKLLQFIFEKVFRLKIDETDEVDEFISDETTTLFFDNELNDAVISNYSALLTKAIKEGMKSEQFYSHLYQIIFSSFLLDERYKKAIALTLIVSRKEMPYREIVLSGKPAIETFESFNERYPNFTEQVDFILNLNLDYKTDYSFALMGELNKIEEENDKIIALTKLLNIHRYLIREEFEADYKRGGED